MEPCLVVRLEDGLQLAIPRWMLDPQRCESLRDEDAPVIAISALRQLAELVDQQTLLAAQDADSPRSSSNHQRGSDEQEPASPSATAEQT